MKLTSLVALAALGSVYAIAPVSAQQSMEGVDPACIMKDANGVDAVDKTKCPDGKAMGTAGQNTTGQNTTGTDPNASGTATTAQPDANATTNNSMAAGGLFVPQESLNNATLITGSDFTGKRIYSKAGDDIGEVNDVIFSADGKVIAAVLGVGGFLGLGEKDVLVSMNAIQFVKDGDNTKLVVDATKDTLTSAPGFDRTKRTYLVN